MSTVICFILKHYIKKLYIFFISATNFQKISYYFRNQSYSILKKYIVVVIRGVLTLTIDKFAYGFHEAHTVNTVTRINFFYEVPHVSPSWWSLSIALMPSADKAIKILKHLWTGGRMGALFEVLNSGCRLLQGDHFIW